jgi:polyphosphate kinase 2 (PPK2 family)
MHSPRAQSFWQRGFRVREGEKVKLRKWPTRAKPFYQSKEHYQKILAEHTRALSRQQNLLYAQNQYAVLLIFQAMDAAGKDGAIKHVMSGINPQGCEVFSFKHPAPRTWNTIFSGARPLPAGTRAHRHFQPLLL